MASCTINADEKRAWVSWLLDSVPVPSTCRGLWIATLSVSLSPEINKPLLYSISGLLWNSFERQHTWLLSILYISIKYLLKTKTANDTEWEHIDSREISS